MGKCLATDEGRPVRHPSSVAKSSTLGVSTLLAVEENALVGLGHRALLGERHSDVVVAPVHLLAIGQQLYALILQLLQSQTLYLTYFLHTISPPFVLRSRNPQYCSMRYSMSRVLRKASLTE